MVRAILIPVADLEDQSRFHFSPPRVAAEYRRQG